MTEQDVPLPVSRRTEVDLVGVQTTVVVDPREELQALAAYVGTFEYLAAAYDPGCLGCNRTLEWCMFEAGARCCDECHHEVVR